jgi:hypothetical protein
MKISVPLQLKKVTLTWLRSDEVDCPWDIQMCLSEAKDNNRTEVVQWLKSFLE